MITGPPPSPLERAVEVMDRLRSPGGCPWDAAQTHRSLTRYLLEETYEVIEAIETADAALLREELGDLLLQVLFHARIAEEPTAAAGGEPFGIDEVAGDLVDKLVRRHPHVFGEDRVADLGELDDVWERSKALEKGRTSLVDGVPLDQPALALAAKLVARARRAGIGDTPLADDAPPADRTADATVDGNDTADAGVGRGARLLEIVVEAVQEGADPEAELRETLRGYRARLLERERSGKERPDR